MNPLTPEQEAKVARLARFFYATVPAEYQTFCSFTARVSLGVLTKLGIEAQLLPCQLWAASPEGNYVIGFIDAPRREGRWDGHVICQAGDQFIDTGLIHLSKESPIQVPPVIHGRRFMAPTNVIGRHDLNAETTLWWHLPPPQADLHIPPESPALIERYVAALMEQIFDRRTAPV